MDAKNYPNYLGNQLSRQLSRHENHQRNYGIAYVAYVAHVKTPNPYTRARDPLNLPLYV